MIQTKQELNKYTASSLEDNVLPISVTRTAYNLNEKYLSRIQEDLIFDMVKYMREKNLLDFKITPNEDGTWEMTCSAYIVK